MTILVGTASWSDGSLIDSGKFYPRNATTSEARLKYYAQHFPIVEVDSSYYAIPVPATAQLWAERSPPGFVFNVKPFRLFTGHQTQPKVFPRDIQDQLGMPLTKNVYYGVVNVIVDGPQGFATSVPSVWEVTSPVLANRSDARSKRRNLGQEGP